MLCTLILKDLQNHERKSSDSGTEGRALTDETGRNPQSAC